jgi:DNA polymerase-3 subunit epsilon
MREIIFDTETTGLSPREGHRLVEIGCVEMVDRFLTGRTFHVYLNPERDMPQEAFEVHGLSEAFLRDKPVFAAVAADFADFIGDATLVAHNASFDIGFINAEFAGVGMPAVSMDRVVDTLLIARRRFPGARNDLNTLCQRFGIDISRRTKHGALMDAELLSDVYVELTGGRQAVMALTGSGDSRTSASDGPTPQRPVPLPPRLDEAAIAAHLAFVASLGDKAIWLDYASPAEADRPATLS